MLRSSLVLAFFVACTPNTTQPIVAAPETTADAGPVVSAPAPDAAIGQTRVLDDAVDAGPKMCGCGLCDPIPSGDACKVDTDCAPETPCHATACVAKAKSAPRTKDIMCTQEVRCATADANACGCLAGVCTLYKKK